jgi:hypothetical protein
MFGNRKKKSVEEVAAEKVAQSKKEAEAKAPTPVMEAKVEEESPTASVNIAKYIVDEFQKTYFGIIGDKDMEKINGEVLNTNLLFAIYGELRLARLEREQK